MAETREYTEAEAAVFHKTREVFGGLSNMAGGYPYRIGDIEIRSSEHHYQAARFPDFPDIQKAILDTKSVMFAKREAYKHIKLTRGDWLQVNIRIMKHVIRLRYAFNRPALDAIYQKTGDLPIVEKSTKDDFWGAKPIGRGRIRGVNALGRLHMELRQEIRQDPEVYSRKVEAPDIPNYRLCGKEIYDVEIPEDHIAKAWQPDFGL